MVGSYKSRKEVFLEWHINMFSAKESLSFKRVRNFAFLFGRIVRSFVRCAKSSQSLYENNSNILYNIVNIDIDAI